MKRTAKIKLNPTEEQRQLLHETLQPANAACNYISDLAWQVKKRSGKEQRFANDVNHCIAKQLVNTAQGTGRGIAFEDLKGIRRRARFRKSQNTPLQSGAFHDLQQKILYKAQLAGVPVVDVDPRHTSRMCSCCGHIDNGNRKTQDNVLCIAYGFSAHADVNAAVNIGRRVSVNAPYADSEWGSNPA